MKAFYSWMMTLILSAMLTGAATAKAAHGLGDWLDAALFAAWGIIAGSMLGFHAKRLSR